MSELREVIIGDSIEVMKTLPDDSFGGVVTSPPYNIGLDYKGARDDRSVEEYSAFTRSWVSEALRVAPVAAINYGARTSDPVSLARFMLDLDAVAVVQSHITWVKALSTEEWSVGHFKPVNSRRYLTNLHESVFIVSRDGSYPLDRLSAGVPFADKSNITRFKGNAVDRRCRGNVWFVPYRTRTAKKEHPATYPEELASLAIRLIGTPPKILDPFYGTGTSGRAAEGLGVRCTGIDLVDWGDNSD